MYENLAAKYRPKNFCEVLGQDAVKTTLANSVKLNRLAHAYVFYGPRGCGKTTIARILAKILNCHKPKDGVPCDKCPSCLEIAESKSLDVMEIDAASNTDVEHVRNVIIEQAGLSPSRDKYKIYILDEVHMLSKQAFNALLKTIEEPPGHVVFVMATTEQTKVPLTILSRSQCFRFRPVPEALIAERLREVASKEKLKASDEALAVIAGAAGGAVRDALTLLDRAAAFGKGSIQAEVLNELLGHASIDLLAAAAAALVKREPSALHAVFENISEEGYDPLTFLRDLRNLTTETFLFLEGFSRNRTALAAALDKESGPALLARLSRKLNAVIDEIKFSDSPLLAAEMALFTLTETPHDLDGLVRRLEALEGRLVQAAPAPVPSLREDSKGLPLRGVQRSDQAQRREQAPKNGVGETAERCPPVGKSPGRGPGRAPLGEHSAVAKAMADKPAVDRPGGVSKTAPRECAGCEMDGQKKSNESTPGPLQLPKAPGAAGAAEAAGPPAVPSSALWKNLLSAISAKKPVLYNILLSARVAFEQDHIWKLSSSNKFEADIMEKAGKELEEIMEGISGRKVSFIVGHDSRVGARSAAGDVLETAAETEDAALAETPQPRPGPPPRAPEGAPQPEVRWEDVGASKQAEEEAELRKLSKVFHGKITRIHKLK